MPHLIIEYSDNVANEIVSSDIAEKLHYALGQCGLFKLDDIKTRSYAAKDFLVGDQGKDGSFLHLSLSIKAGRTLEQRQALSKTLLDMLTAHTNGIDQLTVDIREMDSDVYQKMMR